MDSRFRGNDEPGGFRGNDESRGGFRGNDEMFLAFVYSALEDVHVA